MHKETCGETSSESEGSISTAAPDGAAAPADPAAAAPAEPAAPGKRFVTGPTGMLYRSIRSKPFLSKMSDNKTYHCYEVHVKASEYEYLWNVGVISLTTSKRHSFQGTRPMSTPYHGSCSLPV